MTFLVILVVELTQKYFWIKYVVQAHDFLNDIGSWTNPKVLLNQICGAKEVEDIISFKHLIFLFLWASWLI